MSPAKFMRMIGIIVGGVVLAFVLGSLLAAVLTPDSPKLIAWMFSANPNDPRWPEMSSRWNRVRLISAYVIGPLIGVGVGLFVGFLQKSKAWLVATICMLPNFVMQYELGRPNLWISLTFLWVRFLPFLAAGIVAEISHQLIVRPWRQAHG